LATACWLLTCLARIHLEVTTQSAKNYQSQTAAETAAPRFAAETGATAWKGDAVGRARNFESVKGIICSHDGSLQSTVRLQNCLLAKLHVARKAKLENV
jgi:hypothetical protein